MFVVCMLASQHQAVDRRFDAGSMARKAVVYALAHFTSHLGCVWHLDSFSDER